MKQFDASPSASSLIEGLRDFGYTLETALADVVDNAISAGASRIDVFADVDPVAPRLAVLDDGAGMSEAELHAAMRPGSSNPLAQRRKDDLGRFGLGMKTASFSQCRRMTVVTRKSGMLSAAIWDLDHVAETDRWSVLVPADPDQIDWVEKLNGDGTIVIWEHLDRVVGQDNPEQRARQFTKSLDEAASHLELVFHRFLVSEGPSRQVSMYLNNRQLKPFDPFNRKNPATVHGPQENIKVGDDMVRVQPFTLPHHSKVSSNEWERLAGASGYARSQGFYVYRARRLIVWGTWFGLMRQSEPTKLARVQIDIPVGMDEAWKVNVLKAAAEPPSAVKNRLRRIIEPIAAQSKRIYKQRGVRQASELALPVWDRVQEKAGIAYRPSVEHPAIFVFAEGLDADRRRAFSSILELLSVALPTDALLSDMTDNPDLMKGKDLDSGDLRELTESTVTGLRERGVDWDRVRGMMEESAPFSFQWDQTAALIDEIENG